MHTCHNAGRQVNDLQGSYAQIISAVLSSVLTLLAGNCTIACMHV